MSGLTREWRRNPLESPKTDSETALPSMITRSITRVL
jgi:hypothetical protein